MTTYQLIDSGNFKKLEQVGPYRMVRPSPQAVWEPRLAEREWQRVDATYTRFTGGDGKWQVSNRKMASHWKISFAGFSLVIERTDFGHLGIFPEQLTNWHRLQTIVKDAGRQLSILNLFAYTGASSLACAAAGAKVVHVDASKTSVNWARENAQESGLGDAPIRWIVDDVRKFVERELRRGSRYDGIILDPPSYGRGAEGEVWKIEDHLVPLLASLKQLCSEQFKFLLLSAHSPSYSPLALHNLVGGFRGENSVVTCEEMVIPEESSERMLPSGASCLLLN
jgi:23S rRNA (cytosine1962-C5)-methyltransferase